MAERRLGESVAHVQHPGHLQRLVDGHRLEWSNVRTINGYVLVGCQVPNFANVKMSNAAGLWTNAGFTGTITILPAPSSQVQLTTGSVRSRYRRPSIHHQADVPTPSR